MRAPGRAELDFVVVTGVDQRDRLALVEPFLQFAGRDSWSRAAAGVDPRHTEGNDFLFDFHQHSIERLMITLADLRGKIVKTGNAGAKEIEQRAGGVRLSRDDDVDSF